MQYFSLVFQFLMFFRPQKSQNLRPEISSLAVLLSLFLAPSFASFLQAMFQKNQDRVCFELHQPNFALAIFLGFLSQSNNGNSINNKSSYTAENFHIIPLSFSFDELLDGRPAVASLETFCFFGVLGFLTGEEEFLFGLFFFGCAEVPPDDRRRSITTPATFCFFGVRDFFVGIESFLEISISSPSSSWRFFAFNSFSNT